MRGARFWKSGVGMLVNLRLKAYRTSKSYAGRWTWYGESSGRLDSAWGTLVG